MFASKSAPLRSSCVATERGMLRAEGLAQGLAEGLKAFVCYYDMFYEIYNKSNVII